MNNGENWVLKYQNKHKREQLLMLLSFLIPFALSFVFGFTGGSFTAQENASGTMEIMTAHPILTWLGIICSIVSVVNFILVFIKLLHTRCDVAHYKGSTILAYVLNKKVALIIDDKEVECVRRMNYKDFVILNGTSSTGVEVTCKVSARETTFSYKEVDIFEGSTTIKVVNNYNRSGKKTSRDELTPIQKKLVKMAKDDTLASINPANIEDAKEKLDLYKDLDELD